MRDINFDLPPETLEELKDMTRILDKAEEHAKKLQRSELDDGGRVERVRNLKKKTNLIRDNFFPGQSLRG